MEDSNGLNRLEAAFNRYVSFREFAKKVSTPSHGSVVLSNEWKPFYAKSMIPTASVRMNPGYTVDVLDLRQKFAQSRFSVYSKLVSNFSGSDCGCSGEDN